MAVSIIGVVYSGAMLTPNKDKKPIIDTHVLFSLKAIPILSPMIITPYPLVDQFAPSAGPCAQDQIAARPSSHHTEQRLLQHQQ